MKVEVVTRYGGRRHAAPADPGGAMCRHYTDCRGTSSWTIESWEARPDHPLGLSAEDMRQLPLCPTCWPERVPIEDKTFALVADDHRLIFIKHEKCGHRICLGVEVIEPRVAIEWMERHICPDPPTSSVLNTENRSN